MNEPKEPRPDTFLENVNQASEGTKNDMLYIRGRLLEMKNRLISVPEKNSGIKEKPELLVAPEKIKYNFEVIRNTQNEINDLLSIIEQFI